MTLANLITNHAAEAAAASDWSAVAELLNAPSITVRDSTPLTYARIRREFGDNVRAKVAGTLRAIAASENPLVGEIADAHSVMLNERVGLDVSSDDRQAIIDQIAVVGGWSAEESAQIKSLGVRMQSLAEQDGLDSVSAEQCETVWNEMQRADLLQSLQQQFDAIKNQIGTSEQPDAVAALRAMADELEAG